MEKNKEGLKLNSSGISLNGNLTTGGTPPPTLFVDAQGIVLMQGDAVVFKRANRIEFGVITTRFDGAWEIRYRGGSVLLYYYTEKNDNRVIKYNTLIPFNWDKVRELLNLTEDDEERSGSVAILNAVKSVVGQLEAQNYGVAKAQLQNVLDMVSSTIV